MAHRVVSNVSLNCQIVDSVESACSVVSVMDGIVFNVRLCYSTNHMEVEWISTKLECLTDLCELNVFNSSLN